MREAVEVMARAENIVRETMAAALPPGSPMVFQSIEKATFETKRSIVAHLTMFDGQHAIARLNAWAMGWSIGWDEMPGGAASLENGAWRRVAAAAQVDVDPPPE